ncbi:Endoplasmic reticulum transmembrane protein [Heracleum sosnowskyi]|uniref:Endoplasmic reticulum transmembrane protein n=1 Tax=Heracleum sosnowskyi TaxID=360622 RepID=A0AAD8GT48_9APIA|nr:Endoplasmic reticulum transmembrane protein [Heracleum sosnowskyi]
MIQLLFILMFSEMAAILLLLFKTPLRKLLIMAFDRAKRGKAPLVVKSVAATVFVIMMYNVYAVRDIQSRPVESRNPTDQILLADYMLQASLIGFSLFLSFMIDKLHHYIRELRMLRKAMETAKNQSCSFEDSKNNGAGELKDLGDEVSNLRTKIKELESDCESKDNEIKSAQSSLVALKSQSEGYVEEISRLQHENQNFQNQLQTLDNSLSHSDGKKNM